ncbi:S4 domain-containing protein YaaA [Enterococcus hirae]|nr:S4 domain-containing protein YaaA [Enterococcaceae bacterium]MDM8213988.1 S4 domain-containing protein YaaA [Enterococcus hirae]
MKKSRFYIKEEYLTLGQLLKELSLISSGGQAKWFLREHPVYVDSEIETRRGRKLYPGMMVEIPASGTFFMVSDNEPHPES